MIWKPERDPEEPTHKKGINLVATVLFQVHTLIRFNRGSTFLVCVLT